MELFVATEPDFDIYEIASHTIKRIRLFGRADSALCLEGVVLDLEVVKVSIVMNYDDCSLSWLKGDVFSQDTSLTERQVVGMDRYQGVVAFVWVMENQNSVVDAIQVQILAGEAGYNLLQIMGEGAGIVLYSLSLQRPEQP